MGECVDEFTYNNYLQVIGYSWNHNRGDTGRNSVTQNDLVVDIENGNVVVHTRNEQQYPKIKLTANILYSFLIICLTIWPFIGSVVYSIINGSADIGFQNAFQLLFFAQYVTGIIYFKKQHLFENLKLHPNVSIKYLYCLISGFTISLILAIICVVSLNKNLYISVYSEIYLMCELRGKILLSILIFFEKLYSYIIFFTNTITFSILMLYHTVAIQKFSDNLKEFSSGSSAISAKISTIGTEFMAIRNNYGQTVENLGTFFVTTNIIGILGVYGVLTALANKIYSPNDLTNLIVFIIIEIIFIGSIQYSRTSIDDIIKEMSSQIYISKFLEKKTDDFIIPNIESLENLQKPIFDVSTKSMISAMKSNEILNWVILQNILKTEWDKFEILGFEISDTSILQKIFGIFFGIIIAKDVADMLDFWS
jgi:hypothetical protein